VRSPGTSAGRFDNLPGHRDGTATNDDTNGEDGEALAEGGSIHGEGKVAAGGVHPGDDPAQERGKTGGDVEGAALASALGTTFLRSIAVPVAKVLAGGTFGAGEEVGQDGGDGGETAGVSEDDANAPKGEPGALRLGEMRKIG